MKLIDTHCHLHFDNYDADREQVLKNAAQAGVERLICVGCSLADSQRAVAFANDHKGVWATAGSHPHAAKEFLNTPDAAIKLQKLLADPKVVAVGEIGLDYYRDITPKDVQEKLLRTQLEIGLATSLPFVFHVREAWDGFWPIFDSYKGIKGVVHSFSANSEHLQQALERGLYVAFNGLMTYTKDESWLLAAKTAPLERIVLETDAPFLTPVQFRGQRCEPKHTADTCRFLAELRGQEADELAAASTANAIRLFNLSEEQIS